MGAGNRISMLCLGEAIGHGLYDWILQRTETAQTQRWIAAECGREGLLENSKDGGLKHLTTTVLNNPLNMTDPSGFLFKKLYKGFMKSSGVWHTHKLLNDHAPSFVPYISTVLNFIPVVGPWISAAFSANNAFYVTGSFTAGAKAFAISRGSAYIFQQIGGAELTPAERVFAHAMAGGIISELQGGKFGHGFISAGLSKAFMSYANFDYRDGSSSAVAGRTMVAALVGGTISEISGGKFANGAVTAAMAHLYNRERTAAAQRGDMIGALKKEQAWLNSLSPEDAEAFFKLGGLTGDPELVLFKLQNDIHKEILALTINGTAQAISSTPEETSASVFGAIASEASGVVGKAGGLAGRWADYRAIKTINDLSKLFGDQNVNYSADYMCGSTCKLNINIRE